MVICLPKSSSSVLGVCLLVCLTGVLGSPVGAREVAHNEVWQPENNDVYLPLDHASGNELSWRKMSLKTLIKALTRFHPVDKDDVERLPSTENPALADPTPTAELNEDYPASSLAPPLVDDLSDLFYITAQMELDKSHKFTHSFRFGYGAPH